MVFFFQSEFSQIFLFMDKHLWELNTIFIDKCQIYENSNFKEAE